MINEKFSSSQCLLTYSTDCVSVKPFGLAASLPSHYGYGSVHESRRGMTTVPSRTRIEDRGIPGSIHIFEDDHGPFIGAMLAQFGIGAPVENNSIAQSQMLRSQERAFVQQLRRDTTSGRLAFFKECLEKLEEEVVARPTIKKVIIPAGIGWRGIVDVHWRTNYLPLLHDLSDRLGDDVKTILVTLDDISNRDEDDDDDGTSSDEDVKSMVVSLGDDDDDDDACATSSNKIKLQKKRKMVKYAGANSSNKTMLQKKRKMEEDDDDVRATSSKKTKLVMNQKIKEEEEEEEEEEVEEEFPASQNY